MDGIVREESREEKDRLFDENIGVFSWLGEEKESFICINF